MVKGAHPKHPPCPSCGRALYKSAEVGRQVKTTDPWAYCRNKKCDLYLQDQSIDGEPTVVGAKAVEGERKRHDAIAEAKPPKGESGPAPEPEAVAKARARIRELLDRAVPKGTNANTVGIVLALVSQETGNHTAANALIDEYGLEETLGIHKQDAPESSTVST